MNAMTFIFQPTTQNLGPKLRNMFISCFQGFEEKAHENDTIFSLLPSHFSNHVMK